MTNPNGSGEERALRADGLPVFEGEPETGYIQLFASVGGGSRPVEGVTGLITRNIPGSEDPVLLYSLVTDRSGKTQVVPVPAPPASLSTNPDNAHPYACLLYTSSWKKSNSVPLPISSMLGSTARMASAQAR